ncbi:outer membrane protein [Ancylobacter sp.]|uniref:outer membrane protein n=1 Tax=Ancylobacter sp. TaxID=1872567 RepID=UPI003D0BE8B2
MSRLFGSAAFAAALLAGTGAFAADMSYPTKAPVAVVPVFSWTGFYIGANAGWAWSETEVQDNSYNAVLDEGLHAKNKQNGFTVGGQIGFNYQFDNNVVLGVEADLAYLDIDKTKTGIDDSDDIFSAKVDWYGTVRGRLGYAIDRFLPYVTGGVAFGKVKVGYGDTDDGLLDRNSSVSGSSTNVGWVVGGGVEYALTDAWLLRVEYLHIDLGDETHTNIQNERARFDNTLDVVRAGVSYKF